MRIQVIKMKRIRIHNIAYGKPFIFFPSLLNHFIHTGGQGGAGGAVVRLPEPGGPPGENPRPLRRFPQFSPRPARRRQL